MTDEIKREVEFIHYCNKLRKCDWKCFHFDSEGISFGKIPEYFEHDPYFQAHQKYCGGNIIQANVLKEEVLQEALLAERRKAYEECISIFTDKADAVLKDLEKADTATAVAVFTAERNSWLAIANEIRRRMEGV